jgi:hypothetical protein
MLTEVPHVYSKSVLLTIDVYVWITSVIDLLTEVQNRYLIWGIQVGKRVLKAQLIAELVKYIRTRQYGMPGFIQIQPNVTEVI